MWFNEAWLGVWLVGLVDRTLAACVGIPAEVGRSVGVNEDGGGFGVNADVDT